MSKYKFSDADFLNAINTSLSIRDALIKLGVAPHGGSYKSFNLRIKKLNIDTSHFTGQGHLKNKTHNWSKKISIDELLIANSDKVFNTKYKERLIKEGLLLNICSKCGLKNYWQDEPITLHVDHINGDHFDHRIENLRLLCPNCHSQTPTYCSKNNGINIPKIRKSDYKKVLKENKFCIICKCVMKTNKQSSCKKCYNENMATLRNYKTPTKINWPPIEILKEKLLASSYLSLGKELGISDNAIRKHIKNHEKIY